MVGEETSGSGPPPASNPPTRRLGSASRARGQDHTSCGAWGGGVLVAGRAEMKSRAGWMGIVLTLRLLEPLPWEMRKR